MAIREPLFQGLGWWIRPLGESFGHSRRVVWTLSDDDNRCREMEVTHRHHDVDDEVATHRLVDDEVGGR